MSTTSTTTNTSENIESNDIVALKRRIRLLNIVNEEYAEEKIVLSSKLAKIELEKNQLKNQLDEFIIENAAQKKKISELQKQLELFKILHSNISNSQPHDSDDSVGNSPNPGSLSNSNERPASGSRSPSIRVRRRKRISKRSEDRIASPEPVVGSSLKMTSISSSDLFPNHSASTSPSRKSAGSFMSFFRRGSSTRRLSSSDEILSTRRRMLNDIEKIKDKNGEIEKNNDEKSDENGVEENEELKDLIQNNDEDEIESNDDNNDDDIDDDNSISTSSTRLDLNDEDNAPVLLSSESFQRRDRVRNKTADELIESERTYISFLEIMIYKFRNPLMEAINDPDYPIETEHVRKIFSNVDVILNLSQSILSKLDAKTDDSAASSIAKTFIEMAPFLKCYVDYANKFNRALETVAFCRKDERFVNWLETSEKLLQVNLRELLIMPVQRLPRYVMLMETLTERTPEDNPDRVLLTTASTKLREIAAFVDAQKEHFDALTRVQVLAQRLQGFDVMARSGVTHIREDNFMQLYTNKKAEPVIVVLLNDVLLVCRRVNGSKFRQHANANQLSVSEIVMLYAEQKCHKILGQPCQFKIDVSSTNNVPALHFETSAPSVVNAWMASFRSTLQALQQKS